MGVTSFFLMFCSLIVMSVCVPFRSLCAAPVISQYIYPNFSSSRIDNVDNNGAFLLSSNRNFSASISTPGSDPTSYYLSVIHVSSDTVVWTANRNNPISNSDKFYLTVDGISITDDSSAVIWSTPPMDSQVSALQLQDSGNLVLLNRYNVSLWESFDYPTDTIVTGQHLPVGVQLHSALAANNMSSGDYQFLVTVDDAVLQWKGMTYWKLSMDTSSYKNSNARASYLSINSSGLYIFASDGSTIVYKVELARSDFRVAKLEPTGQFTVKSLSNDQWNSEEFAAPDNVCQIPSICGSLSLCFSNGTCSCPPGFQLGGLGGACEPANDFLSLPDACNGSQTSSGLNSSVRYIKLDSGIDYFSNNFVEPFKVGANLSVCQDLCSRNCSCLGVFHENSSGSCYLVENHLGSVMFVNPDQMNRLGYIKAISAAATTVVPTNSDAKNKKFPTVGLVLVPLSAFSMLIAFGVAGLIWWRRKKLSRDNTTKVFCRNLSSEELDVICIPGLPVKFDYYELEAATENFKTQIGSGGFGTVFKGTLSDNTIVAVKKINNLGINGKREFYSEMAILGSIHHVNLVKLKGFSVLDHKRFLVYEYMNRSSLDHALFGSGPVLTWQERFDIALGIARGLAYLHEECVHKIIHCDIKPENILLHENLQVKISDFGLSKLLSPEESNRITTLRGTRGYLAPEWLTSSTISDKSDVYSYGMVLLEIVTGRRNCTLLQTKSLITEGYASIVSSGSESQILFYPLIALQMHEQKRYSDLVDPRLERDVTNQEQVEMLVRVALCCLHQEPMLRPNMSNVVGMLQGEIKLAKPRVEYLEFLRFYGGRLSALSQIEDCNG